MGDWQDLLHNWGTEMAVASYLLPGWLGTSLVYIIFSGGTELIEVGLYNMTLVPRGWYRNISGFYYLPFMKLNTTGKSCALAEGKKIIVLWVWLGFSNSDEVSTLTVSLL